MGSVSRILVANRGEIALRVMRTAKQMGIETVAVYSDADRRAPHVRFADISVHIGASPVGESYLDPVKILSAAAESKADAIHPGYGFLSENAEFARAVQDAGLVFIGPPAAAIEAMGDKARSKRLMIDAGVPCIPGYEGDDQSDKRLISEADEIGFPVMVKASAGGGGRGMRLVGDWKDIAEAITLARSEAANAFGDNRLIVEKAVTNARHVEVQVFADTQGNYIHLGERDCSVQRRHQKVLEEAPCPVMTPELRARMGEAAVEAAKAVNYVGAGTVEFLLGGKEAFYFLEMNTRLQVEHPVTECVTGLDLVEMQIRVARGEALGVTQKGVNLSGHAIEARLYAENPAEGFLPATGPLNLFKEPSGEGIRVDAGVESGGAVSPFYDPMIAKIIASAETRDEARRRLINALQDTAVFGVLTNRDFLIDALRQDAFAQGEATTNFIGEVYGENGPSAPAIPDDILGAAAILQFTAARDRAVKQSINCAPELFGWHSTSAWGTEYIYKTDETAVGVRVTATGENAFNVTIGDAVIEAEMIKRSSDSACIDLNGDKISVTYQISGADISIASTDLTVTLTNETAAFASAAEVAGGGFVAAPMHGFIVDMRVEAGQSVSKGDTLCILEAMKMQHEILAEIDGQVSNIAATANSQIAAGDMILQIEAAD